MPLLDPDNSNLLDNPDKLPSWVRQSAYAIVLLALAGIAVGIVALFLGGVYAFLDWAL